MEHLIKIKSSELSSSNFVQPPDVFQDPVHMSMLCMLHKIWGDKIHLDYNVSGIKYCTTCTTTCMYWLPGSLTYRTWGSLVYTYVTFSECVWITYALEFIHCQIEKHENEEKPKHTFFSKFYWWFHSLSFALWPHLLLANQVIIIRENSMIFCMCVCPLT